MKNRKYITILLTSVIFAALSFIGCGTKNETISDVSSEPETTVNTETTVDTETSPETEVIEPDENSSLDIDVSDEAIKEAIEENIHLAADRQIESYGWVDSSEECYRVAIERTEENENEYQHVEDYFFIKKDDVICVDVEYPSKNDDQFSDRYVFDACDFSAEYTDVTFDGENDIIISLGHQGAAGTEVHCAYIYKDNTFEYTKSFESIPNYSINADEKCIDGEYKVNAFSFVYEDDAFVEK